MCALREITDKTPLIEALREISRRDVGALFLSTPPIGDKVELLSKTHPSLRIIACLSGEYRFEYYNGETKAVTLPVDGMLVTLPGGYLVGAGDKPYRGAQIIFREGFIRYLLVENGESQWYHTGGPLSPYGRHALNGLCSLPLDAAFDGVRKKLAEALVWLALIELERDTSAKKGKAFGAYHLKSSRI